MKWALPLIAFVAGGVLFFVLLAKQDNVGKPELLSSQESCSLSDGVCRAYGAGGRILSLQLSPRHPIPLLKDVEAQLQLEGFVAVRTAQISIEGLSMFMGIQITPLYPDGTGSNRWTGVFKLPVCSTQKMEWKITVSLTTRQKKYQAVFYFQTFTNLMPAE